MITMVDIYDQKKYRFKNYLLDDLVPVISKKSLDVVATDFLKCHYPSALYVLLAIIP